MTLDTGAPATGYATSTGAPLDPDVAISNKGRVKAEMERVLRAFGGATRLNMAPALAL
ncbi:hypothetical protein [Novosphingobium sp. 9U]|uniref:hypothetical protein n=1 Tax=Novosphingobium sp. 9U TaxID=2653158 RepID=UPI0012F1FAAD|nr:hypothetical protein [Novosphingobium sp. 9U]VWX51047.1 hypothetical protein NOVOSPHI9U_370052 [Novosphingobium sp. 9U]